MHNDQSFLLALRTVFLGSLMWLGLLAGLDQAHPYSSEDQVIKVAESISIDHTIFVLSQFDWNSLMAFFPNAPTWSSKHQIDFKYRLKSFTEKSRQTLKDSAYLFYRIKEGIAFATAPARPCHPCAALPFPSRRLLF